MTDKNGKVICGNATLESFAQLADPSAIVVVPTNGTRLVVVQRIDLDLDADRRARELALLDNRVAETNLDWDGQVVAALAQDYGIEPQAIGFTDAEFGELYLQDEADEKPEREVVCPHCGERFTP